MTMTISLRSLLLGAVTGLLLAGPVSAQSQNPLQDGATTMPCPGGMMQGGMGSGMMGQGGQAMGRQMMNWQQMQADMQGLREEMVKLRLELQKRGKR